MREGRVAGVVLFSENYRSRRAGRRAIASLQAIRRPAGLRAPLLVLADQEGGLVKRLGGAPTASAEQMGERPPGFARAQGARTAANLLDAGVNVDLAPVLDVARPGSDIARTDRGFGSTPEAVARTAIPFAEGLRQGGVAATGKHFPGLGSARGNTDVSVQRLPLPRRVLRRVDEAPYRRFASIGGDMVMVSSAVYPALSPRPAAFSRAVATGELRRRLGFHGVSITDALGSAAVADFGGPARAAVAAARAGTDLLLFTELGAGARAARALARPCARDGCGGPGSSPRWAGLCACAGRWPGSGANRRREPRRARRPWPRTSPRRHPRARFRRTHRSPLRTSPRRGSP